MKQLLNSTRRHQPITSDLDDEVLVPAQVVASSAFMSPSGFFELRARGQAPEPDVVLGRRFVRWRVGTARAWLRSLGQS